jgi:hypothetical protein
MAPGLILLAAGVGPGEAEEFVRNGNENGALDWVLRRV